MKTKMRNQASARIWNAAFISIFVANSVMNLGQQMINTLITKYADYLGAQATIAGMLSGAFSATALIFKLFSGPAIDSLNRKKILMTAMAVMAISYAGFGLSKTVPMLFTFRLIEGAARAFTATCCLAIAADTLPAEQFGSGIGFFSLAQAACQAIGPTVGLTLYRYIGYNATFLIGSVCMISGVVATGTLNLKKSTEKKKFEIKLSRVVAKEAVIPAVLLFLLSASFFTVQSFLPIYGTNMGIVNIGLFFTVYACVLLFSRPLIGRLTDQFGLVKITIPALCCFALSFFLISLATNLLMFMLAAFVAAFGFGAAQPAIQTLCMKCVPTERRGSASSTAYIGNDTGNMIGPIIAGYFIEILGYRPMWRIMVVPIAIALIFMLVFNRKITQIEDEFKTRGN